MDTIKKRETVSIECNPKKFMPELLWVLKARSTDPNREILKYMLKDENGITCTDGKRLHNFNAKDRFPAIENGVYDVQVLKDKVIFIPAEGNFPDCQQVKPKFTGKSIILDLEKMEVPGITLSQALIRIFSEFGNGCNYNLLADLSGHRWNEVKSEKDKTIEFKNSDCYALIMPIRL